MGMFTCLFIDRSVLPELVFHPLVVPLYSAFSENSEFSLPASSLK
jgi:hypothetical protein